MAIENTVPSNFLSMFVVKSVFPCHLSGVLMEIRLAISFVFIISIAYKVFNK